MRFPLFITMNLTELYRAIDLYNDLLEEEIFELEELEEDEVNG